MVFKKGEAPFRGEKSPHAKLSWDAVKEIRQVRSELAKAGKKRVPKNDERSMYNLALKYGVTQATISYIISNRSWRAEDETAEIANTTHEDTFGSSSLVDAFFRKKDSQEAG